jgi:hypothetical protein
LSIYPYHHNKLPEDLLRKIDAVEIFNSRTATNYSQTAVRNSSMPYHLTLVGNSDVYPPWEMRRVYNNIQIERLDEHSVRVSLINIRCNQLQLNLAV